MSESLIVSVALRICVWIPYLFSNSLASCLDPLSFRRLSGIVSSSLIVSATLRHLSGSPIFSMTFGHRVRIPYLFYGSSASCPNALSFLRFSNIVSRSPIFWQLSYIMSRSFFFSTVLQHRVWIPYLFYGSLTSCLDPLSFRLLSNIVSGSPFFSTALQHCV